MSYARTASRLNGTAATKMLSLALLMLILLSTLPIQALGAETYTIGVVPTYPPVTMYAQWVPFAEQLSREAGVTLHVKVYNKMSEFEHDIWDGALDFVFTSPIQTVVAHARHGYIPLVHGAKPVSVRLFVRDDSPIKSIDELAGKKIAFVGNKNMCSVYIRHELEKQKRALSYLQEYTGSTSNVIKNVLLGKTDAGAVFVPELDRESPEVRSQLRGLVDTPQVPPHPLCAHPRVPEKIRNAIKNAALKIAETADGADMLKVVRLASPVAADYARDYTVLEEVDVTRLTDWGR